MSGFEVFLILFTLAVGVSIAWSTLRVGISPMPSSKLARQVILRLTEETGAGPIIDLGCGWGNLVIPLALKFPHRQIVGYELSIMPWLTAVILKKVLRLKNLQLYRQDFLKSDWSGAEVIVCYLYPGGMDSIKNKIESEESDIRFVVSNNFALTSHQPDKTIRLNDFYNSPVYLYQLKSTR